MGSKSFKIDLCHLSFCASLRDSYFKDRVRFSEIVGQIKEGLHETSARNKILHPRSCSLWDQPIMLGNHIPCVSLHFFFEMRKNRDRASQLFLPKKKIKNVNLWKSLFFTSFINRPPTTKQSLLAWWLEKCSSHPEGLNSIVFCIYFKSKLHAYTIHKCTCFHICKENANRPQQMILLMI